MSFFEDLEPWFYFTRFRDQLSVFSGTMLASMATASCTNDAADEFRDDAAALQLKMVAMVVILVAGVSGVAIPLVGRKRRFLRTDGSFFVFAKAFAAGVILATGFVHMLHDAQSALTDPCLPESPWRRFPFTGFVAMTAALGTLVVDFVGTQFYERKHREEAIGVKTAAAAAVAATTSAEEDITVISIVPEPEEEADNVQSPMHIVGMHAHAAAHRHSHPHEHGSCDGPAPRESGPGHAHEDDGEVSSHVRHVVVSQAQFRNLSAVLMACFFAITAPTGVGVGAGAASFYNANSPRALVVEGILDSISAGILIYMALVDLIAADFLSRRMSCNIRLQVASYMALFVGAGSMSALAIWA